MTEERPHPLTPLVKAWVALVAFVWFAIQTLVDQPDILTSFDFSRLPFWLIPLLVILALSGLVEIWEWWTTRFIVTDSELRVEHRGLRHESKRIAYSRIQSVDLKQKFAARLLGMAELTIDVGADSSTTLTYLGRERALDLREHLMRRALDAREGGFDSLRSLNQREGEEVTRGEGGFDSLRSLNQQEGDALNHREGHELNQRDREEVTRGEGGFDSLRSLNQREEDALNQQGGDALARRDGSLFTDLEASDRVVVRLQPQDLILGALASLWFWVMLLASLGTVGMAVWLREPIAGAGGLPLLLGLVGYISTQVVNNFNFTLAHTPTGLKITRGLTTLSTQSVPLKRVQAIRIEQALGWRLLRRYRVRLIVLGGLELDENEASVLLPIGNGAQVSAALASVWPWLDLSTIPLNHPPRRARWLAPLAHGWLAWGNDERVVVTREGFFIRTETIIPHARVQSASLTQGPLRRKLGLANVNLHPAGITAAATLRLLASADARSFLDAQLRRVEARG